MRTSQRVSEFSSFVFQPSLFLDVTHRSKSHEKAVIIFSLFVDDIMLNIFKVYGWWVSDFYVLYRPQYMSSNFISYFSATVLSSQLCIMNRSNKWIWPLSFSWFLFPRHFFLRTAILLRQTSAYRENDSQASWEWWRLADWASCLHFPAFVQLTIEWTNSKPKSNGEHWWQMWSDEKFITAREKRRPKLPHSFAKTHGGSIKSINPVASNAAFGLPFREVVGP